MCKVAQAQQVLAEFLVCKVHKDLQVLLVFRERKDQLAHPVFTAQQVVPDLQVFQAHKVHRVVQGQQDFKELKVLREHLVFRVQQDQLV